jgi:hypothetical protein
MCSKMPCIPQKQPPASTIEAVPAAGVLVFGGSGKLAASATVNEALAIAAAAIP